MSKSSPPSSKLPLAPVIANSDSVISETEASNASVALSALSAGQLRRAQRADARAIADLVNSAYRGESSQAGWTTEANILGGQRTDAEAIGGMIEGDEQTILIYEVPFDSAGAVAHPEAPTHARTNRMVVRACVYLKRQDNSCYLGMLTVSPKLQAGGIGRLILLAGEEWAKENWKSQQVEMTVIESRTELIAWYQRRGYAMTSKREPFPSHDPRFGIPLVENLMFVVLEKKFVSESKF